MLVYQSYLHYYNLTLYFNHHSNLGVTPSFRSEGHPPIKLTQIHISGTYPKEDQHRGKTNLGCQCVPD
jgi:hypothetical protein